jgi:hypothetical protein
MPKPKPIPLTLAALACLGLPAAAARGQQPPGTAAAIGPSHVTTALSTTAAPASTAARTAAVVAYQPPPRLPIYAHLMLSGGVLVEDRDLRLTTRSSRTLEGIGGAVRIGANLDDHHRLGGRVQWFARPTRTVAPDVQPAPVMPQPRWGTVMAASAGPEYMYKSTAGFYGAAAVGVGLALSAMETACGLGEPCAADDPRRNDADVQRASVGATGTLSLGYEWRAHPLLAVNAEIFGGLYRGLDDDERSLTNGTYGLALGLGF